jgi:uncharacterized protein YegP (UPF0339 family)
MARSPACTHSENRRIQRNLAPPPALRRIPRDAYDFAACDVSRRRGERTPGFDAAWLFPSGIRELNACHLRLQSDSHPITFEIHQSPKNKEFYFRLKAKNHQVILASEGYKTKASCQRGIASVVQNAASTVTKDLAV